MRIKSKRCLLVYDVGKSTNEQKGHEYEKNENDGY